MAVASVSVTVRPAMTGAVAPSATGPTVPSRGVRLTANAAFARLAAAARVSSKVMTSDVPFTVADANAGAVVSGAASMPLMRMDRE